MKTIVAVFLLVWGCQGLDYNLQNVNKWLGTFLTPTMPSDYCETDQQAKGRCVKISECAETGDGVDLSKMDVYRTSTCHYLKKCCPLDEILTTTEAPPVAKTNGCGYSNPSPSVFLKKSFTHADFGEYPWMVALLSNDGVDWRQFDYLGGGSLIHKSVVITAAHKVHALKPNQVKCRAGEWDTKTTNEAFPHQERDVKDIVIHSDFNRRQFKNNVALLILQTPFDLSVPHIGTACLESKMPPPGTECYSMGWGQKDFNKDEYAVILKKISSPLLDKSVCERAFRPIVGSAYNMDDSLTCAGGVIGLSNCKGDGGSPLICPIPSSEGTRFAVVGLVVLGYRCGANGIPVAFTNVPQVYNWVDAIMKTYNYDTTSFEY
ncbi:phenoloxidase-activating factor 2-like [Pieris brassicae]|uniref:phenoloxidase-activating factor 2-like n=1 Tax=Pieris brassicae TaxID=7116 RepID=UPI001E660BD9|nr:phenoloxidase-activating factor 2-like [Pieris brassicae]